MRGERVLVVMARYPEVGAVKTRLAATHGPERATALYRGFIADLDARFRARPRRLVWAYHPAEQPFADVVHAGACCIVQDGDDLGARMHGCFRVLCSGGAASVVMIGADVPHVRDAWLDEAEARLCEVDVVLGPSSDGGYYLIAMRAPHDLFTGVRMSTTRVLADTERKIAAAGLRVHLLAPSFDVDEAADVERLRVELQAPELAGRLPATAAWLARGESP
jgi:rSAM/selenodomain-associated transferase 1